MEKIMNITTNQRPVSYTGFIPLSDYKGVILKLTSKDKAKIELLQKEKAQYILEQDKLRCINASSKHMSEGMSIYMCDNILKLETKIEDINNEIRRIKANRLAKQKARSEKRASKLDIES